MIVALYLSNAFAYKTRLNYHKLKKKLKILQQNINN